MTRLNSEFTEGRLTCKAEIDQVQQVTRGRQRQLNGMEATFLGAVIWIAKVDNCTVAVRGIGRSNYGINHLDELRISIVILV